jgi:small subunit ribosomal protein S5
LAKSLGSPTHLNVAKATMQGLLNQRTPDIVAKLRGKKPSEVAPPGLVAAYENTKAQKKVQVADES